MIVLAGDIGGTHSRLAIIESKPRGATIRTQGCFPSGEYNCLEAVIARFLDDTGATCDAVCLGLPGPVSENRTIHLTNLPWRIEPERIRQASGIRKVKLINDVEASAIGISEIKNEEFDCLHEGHPDQNGNRTLISVGTGLGVAGLTPSGRAFATEAGHSSFSPQTEDDFRLLRLLQAEFGHVSWERLVSGPALPRIHSFVAGGSGPVLTSSEIVSRCGEDDQCRHALDLLGSYLGSVAGNIALTLMATGGVYLGGGVAPPIVDACGPQAILNAFFEKGRMRMLLERMPVFLVRDANIALKGAAHAALTATDAQ